MQISLENISLIDAANIANVSVATIRNWIKAGYLSKTGKGVIAAESLDKFLKEVAGNEKLKSRANKLNKDKHNHAELRKWVKIQVEKQTNLEEISQVYEQKLSEAFKNKEGIFYTPEAVIEKMFENIEFNKNLLFCDPACGTGNFLIKAIEFGIQPENIYGFDTDKNAVDIAKARIYQMTGFWSENIKNVNFLEFVSEQKSLQKFDLIFTNPPWGKKIPKKDKEKYGKIYDTGKSLDTTSLFFSAALKMLKKNGVLGFLVQEAFFNIATFEDIRKKILKYQILRITDFGKAFKGLLTKAQAIILKNTEQKNNEILCEYTENTDVIEKSAFAKNPKSIFNFWVTSQETKIIDNFFKKKHTTLKNKAKWGLGIVTGNNKKYCSNTFKQGYIPIYRGSDITPNGLKQPNCYILPDFSLYQQVAPIEFYTAKEKLIYRFIYKKLIFYHDTEQRFILNSANLMIPTADLGITQKQLADLLNSNIMNWVFSKLFNTHKILRSDLEVLPIHTDFFAENKIFDEDKFLKFLN